jgi:hypothetical protein
MKTSSVALLAALATVLSFTACTSSQKNPLTVPYTDPDQFAADFRQVSKVFQVVRDAAGIQSRTHVGWAYQQAVVEKDRTQGQVVHWVETLGKQRLGFVNESRHAFKLVPGTSSKGKPGVSHEDLGRGTLEEGVHKLLGLDEGTVEFVTLIERGTKPIDR